MDRDQNTKLTGDFEQTEKLRESHLPTIAMRCAGAAGTSYLIARAVLRLEMSTPRLPQGSPARLRALRWAVDNGFIRRAGRKT